MSYRTAALAAALLLVPGVAAADIATGDRAARSEQRLQQHFDAFDRDRDGRVTAAEVEAFRAERFGAVDANKDGAVDRAEFDAMVEQMRRERTAKWFERIDADKDGRIAVAEFDRRAGKMIERLDADKDGAVTMDEMRAARQHRHKKAHRHN